VLGAILYLLGWLPKADAGKLAYWIRKSSGVLLAAAAALLLTRNPGLAVLAGMLAYSVMQKTGWFPGSGGQPRMGSISTVRTSYLEMSLDHATGAMSGRALKGRYAGREFSSFTVSERAGYLAELSGNDTQGAQLFEAYLDRTSPGWDSGAQASAGQASGRGRGMGIEEAYLVLGLSPGASRADIQAAHRNLMKRFHPDQGGSTYLASKVNEAKDVLLKNVKT
jgi:DnaJ domain